MAKSGSNRSELASEIGQLSWYYLFNGQFSKAKDAAEEGHYLDSEQILILTNLAHAEMFLGHLEAARNIHARHTDDVITQNGDSKKWGDVIASDFAAFRKVGLESPHIAAVERLMAAGDQD